MALQVPYIYDYITKLCRKQAEVKQNHENEKVRCRGQSEARHRKCKRLKLGGGLAYDRSSDWAAVVTWATRGRAHPRVTYKILKSYASTRNRNLDSWLCRMQASEIVCIDDMYYWLWSRQMTHPSSRQRGRPHRQNRSCLGPQMWLDTKTDWTSILTWLWLVTGLEDSMTVTTKSYKFWDVPPFSLGEVHQILGRIYIYCPSHQGRSIEG
jgi:hypothetical protein